MSERPTMLAVTGAEGPAPSRLPRPEPLDEGEVLVRVERVGICGTDRAILDEYADHDGVLGHEFSGVVVQADLYAWMRRRVTASINIPDGARGSFDPAAAKHDPGRTALGIRGRDGAMAEYVLVPEGALVVLPDNVSFAAGALAEPLAAAMDGVARAGGGDGAVLVVGDGTLGQLALRVLRASGREVHVWGRHADKLNLAADAGASALERPPAEGSYRRVIEASGSAEGIHTALAATAPEGRLVLQTTLPRAVELDLARVVVQELELVGSRCGDVAEAVRWLAEERVQVEDLVTDLYPLEEAEAAFAQAEDGGSIKVQLSPHGA